MSLKALIEDAVTLYRSERFHSAFCLSLISVEGAANLRYGEGASSQYVKSTGKRFKRFLDDETKHDNIRAIHGVDLPPQPEIGTPPPFPRPESANCADFIAKLNQWRTECDEWLAADTAACDAYKAQIKDVGDNFAGKRVNRGGRMVGKNIGVPRLVSTAGVLYQARCEMVHEGRLASIRIVAVGAGAGLSVGGADPIEFSSTWIANILAIVTGAKEVRPLFSGQ